MAEKNIQQSYWSFFIGSPAIVWQILFFYIPLLTIVLSTFRYGIANAFTPFLSSVYFVVFLKTTFLAVATTFLCLVIAYPVAYWLAFRVHKWKSLFLFFLFIPFWSNFLLHVYAWMFVLERNGILNTFLQNMGVISEPLSLLNTSLAVMILMVYCYLPFMLLPLYSTIESLDRDLIEAASDLGATRWQAIKQIIWPLSLPGIRSGVFLVFVPAFGEFAIPELVGGDKTMYVGSVISHFTLSSHSTSLGSAFTLLSSIIALVLVGSLSYLLQNRRG